jgi:hypothetical protein
MEKRLSYTYNGIKAATLNPLLKDILGRGLSVVKGLRIHGASKMMTQGSTGDFTSFLDCLWEGRSQGVVRRSQGSIGKFRGFWPHDGVATCTEMES